MWRQECWRANESTEGDSVTILILSALDEELRALRAELALKKDEQWGGQPILYGTLFGKEVVLARSGVGKAISAATAQRLCDLVRPKRLIFTGVAGALNPEYQIGDIVIARDVVQHDLDASPLGFARGLIPYTDIRFLQADPDLCGCAASVRLDGTTIRVGRILTGDQFITHEVRARAHYLTEELAGDAVEMEGAAVALVAHLNHVPWLLIRTISDRADGGAVLDFGAFLQRTAAHEVQLLREIL